MDNATKQRIIEFNRRLGLKTEFITAEEGMLGYAQNYTIYINESIEQDYERTNKHEVLHFFEGTPEFEDIKQTILSSVEKRLDQIRAEYELRYFGIYSEDEIKAGVLDNEIVIDLLVDNSIIEYENGLVVGDRLLGDIEKGLEERRYLNMSIRRNIQNMNLSNWEKLFVENYYDGKEHILPQADKSRGIKREDAIRQDIENYLEQLYAMSEEEFVIDPHSPEVIREYESEIKALQARGEDVSPLEYNKEMALQRIADEHSKHLYEEYKHIVDQIKGMNFEPSFKSLMLRETLTKTYKLEKDDDGKKTIVKNRDMHKSIASHMILNEETLSFIYQHRDNLEEYSNFANLYFAALEVYNKSIAEKSGISLEGVDTYGMGQWIKFDGKESNVEEYLENAERLAALVKDTPWCTKTLASSQLAEGDFFVFVDNEGNPHIAVRMEGNQIAEVRGIQNGNEQAIEEEYRDVAISFLENNQEIKNGREWLESEEWNKRLVEYQRKIEDNTFSVADVPMLLKDLGFREHNETNQNLERLKDSLESIKSEIAEYYGFSGDDIYTGKFGRDASKVRQYKIILGDADFRGLSLRKLENIELITGRTDGIYEMIIPRGETERIRPIIERRNLLGLDDFSTKCLIRSTEDQEYIRNCIDRSKELRFSSEFTTELIIDTKDSKYIKQCIEKREELGVEKHIWTLIAATNDKKYIKQCIEKREELGISTIVLEDIQETTGYDYSITKVFEDALSDIGSKIFDVNPNIKCKNHYILSKLGEILSNGKQVESIELKIVSSDDGSLQDSLLVINGMHAIGLDSDLKRDSDGNFEIEENTNSYSDWIPNEFDRLREEALTNNPNTKIIIEGRSIIFNDGETETIYIIDEWNDCLVLADKVETVEFNVPEKEKNRHQIDEVAQFAYSEASIDAERAIQEAEREKEQSNKEGEEK